MKIGIIGAGTVAQTIAKHVLPLGHKVMLSNTHGPESLAPLVKQLGPGASAGTPQQAADQDIVILAVMWWHVQAALFSIPDWKIQDPQIPQSIWYLTDAKFLGFRIIRPLKTPSADEMDSGTEALYRSRWHARRLPTSRGR